MNAYSGAVNDLPDARENALAGAQQAVGRQRRRLAEVRAREHVGAAGWAQTSTLEQIIRAGQEGLAATDALRQVVKVTTEQLRSLPMAAAEQQRQEHAQALARIVASGEEQSTAAASLDGLVCQALEDVARTPMSEVSVRTLRQIHDRVQAQLGALSTIIEAARAQANTLEQVARLERVSAEHQARVEAIQALSADHETQMLAEVGEQIVERIGELDEAGGKQLVALQRVAEAALSQVAETGTLPEQQAEMLQTLAKTAQQQAEALQPDGDAPATG